MIEQVKEKLSNSGWTYSEETSTFTTSVSVPVQKVVINGQAQIHRADVSLSVSYLGEGEMWDPIDEESKKKIYGFCFSVADNATDIWVENMDDFNFWFNQYQFNATYNNGEDKN